MAPRRFSTRGWARREHQFWLHIMNELWNHGVEDIPFTVVDGLRVIDYCTTIFPVIWG
jgi:hypothetical protein